MTLNEALNAGYKLGDVRLQLGYVSRRCDPGNQPVLKAGSYRRGELYVLLPNYNSTRYCYRQYLVKDRK